MKTMGQAMFGAMKAIETAHAIAVSPVPTWAAQIAALPEDERKAVRDCLEAIYRQRKGDAALEAEVQAGRVVWMNIRCGEAL